MQLIIHPLVALLLCSHLLVQMASAPNLGCNQRGLSRNEFLAQHEPRAKCKKFRLWLLRLMTCMAPGPGSGLGVDAAGGGQLQLWFCYGDRYPQPRGASSLCHHHKGAVLDLPPAQLHLQLWSRKSRGKTKSISVILSSFPHRATRVCRSDFPLGCLEPRRSSWGGGTMLPHPAGSPPLSHPQALPSHFHPITELFLAMPSTLALCCCLLPRATTPPVPLLEHQNLNTPLGCVTKPYSLANALLYLQANHSDF